MDPVAQLPDGLLVTARDRPQQVREGTRPPEAGIQVRPRDVRQPFENARVTAVGHVKALGW
jgi:hypothetical protein